MSPQLEPVAHLPHEALSFAAWREMCGDRFVPGKVPAAMKAASAAFERLSPADAELARAFGAAVWSHVSNAVGEVADPLDVGSPREQAARKQLRAELSLIDQWTFDVMWSVAFTQWMM